MTTCDSAGHRLENRDPGADAGAPTERAPASLTQADVRDFQRLMREECGVVLDDTEAWQRARELATLARMLLAPLPEDPERVISAASSNVVALARFPKGKLF